LRPFHSDLSALLLPGTVSPRPGDVSHHRRQFPANAEPPPASPPDRSGCHRCDRGGCGYRHAVPAGSRTKRGVVIAAAVLGFVIAWPLFLLIPILIRLGDGGPVFFRQERIGRGGRSFRIWKFRTMRQSGDGKSPLTVGQDPRITRVGRWLREFKLDEIPQLINLLVGEMSL